MRFFRNVFQYKYAEKVLSKTFEDYSRTVDTYPYGEQGYQV